VTVKALRLLTAYPWPGNVRELEHAIRRQVVLCPRGGAIDSSQLPAAIIQGAMEAQEGEEPTSDAGLEPRLEALEGRLIRRALVTTGGNQTRAAKILKISRNGLAKRLKRLGISPDELIPH
jgi:transcriptional regulator with PAS, ATPase and Fis domain